MTDFPKRPERDSKPARLSVAPMMDRTDRHFRYLVRLMSKHTLLYTEMVTTGAIIYGDRQRYLQYNAEEHPLSLQLGGDDPVHLAECARIATDFGYDEINLNVGCPSDRVKNGNFGACLMGQPDVVARAVEAMCKATHLPVTVKHRIGIDYDDSYEFMLNFVDTVAAAGCQRFSVHARIAWLNGLSPKDNRKVPPLRYEDVYRLKRERPELDIELNGGITSIEQTVEVLEQVDAVMIGRAAYENPMMFARADTDIFKRPTQTPTTPHAVLEQMVPYVERYIAEGGRMKSVTRHLLNLFNGYPGARAYRRCLSENARLEGFDQTLLLRACQHIPAAA